MKKILSLFILSLVCDLNIFGMEGLTQISSSSSSSSASLSSKTACFHLGAILTALTGKFLTLDVVAVDVHRGDSAGQLEELSSYMLGSSCSLFSLYRLWLPKCGESLDKQNLGLKEKALSIWQEEGYQNSLENLYRSNEIDCNEADTLTKDLIKKFLFKVGTECFKLSKDLDPASSLEYFLPVKQIESDKSNIEKSE